MKKQTHFISFATSAENFKRLKDLGKTHDNKSAHQYARDLVEAALEDKEGKLLQGLNLIAMKMTQLEKKIDEIKDELQESQEEEFEALREDIAKTMSDLATPKKGQERKS